MGSSKSGICGGLNVKTTNAKTRQKIIISEIILADLQKSFVSCCNFVSNILTDNDTYYKC